MTRRAPAIPARSDDESAIRSFDTKTGAPLRIADHTCVLESSRALRWHGIVAERGVSQGFASDGFAMSGHTIAINLNEAPLRMEMKNGTRRFTRERIPPRGMRVMPALFELKVRKPNVDHWGAVFVDAALVNALMGRTVAPLAEVIDFDDALYSTAMALLHEARAGGPSGRLFVDGLTLAIASQLARRAGIVPRYPSACVGPKRMNVVFSFIEDFIGEELTIGALAQVAGLSPAHFAREFKRVTHETPHQFVMRRRLERAKALVLQGVRLADIARLCGFADQAHLSRRFRTHFGAPPAAFARGMPRD